MIWNAFSITNRLINQATWRHLNCLDISYGLFIRHKISLLRFHDSIPKELCVYTTNKIGLILLTCIMSRSSLIGCVLVPSHYWTWGTEDSRAQSSMASLIFRTNIQIFWCEWNTCNERKIYMYEKHRKGLSRPIMKRHSYENVWEIAKDMQDCFKVCVYVRLFKRKEKRKWWWWFHIALGDLGVKILCSRDMVEIL